VGSQEYRLAGNKWRLPRCWRRG